MNPPKNSVLLVVGFFLSFLVGCSTIGGRSPTAIPTSDPAFSVSAPSPSLVFSHIPGRVVYSQLVSREPFVTQIFLENLDTAATQQLTYSGNNGFPKWSPDGSQIMFLSWTAEDGFDIYIMDDDGGHQRPIVASPANEMMPDWSPDGSKIVFVSGHDNDYGIYVFDLGTETTIKLTNDANQSFSPRWSSSGRQIAFVSNSSDNLMDARSQVFIMNADGTGIKQLTGYDLDNFDASPVWCPDDSCIVFARPSGPLKLMFLDLASGDTARLLSSIFGPTIQETGTGCSPVRGYITFSARNMFYAMDITTGAIYSLGVEALDLSLYP